MYSPMYNDNYTEILTRARCYATSMECGDDQQKALSKILFELCDRIECLSEEIDHQIKVLEARDNLITKQHGENWNLSVKNKKLKKKIKELKEEQEDDQE